MISDCDCGSTTCPSCGPAQGYSVERVWCPDSRQFVWRNPEEEALADDDTDEGEAP